MEDVATPTYSMKNCLQRALIGNHSNCIVRPLEAILKETNIHFEEKEPYYNCTLASTECDAVLLNLIHSHLTDTAQWEIRCTPLHYGKLGVH